MQVVAGEPLILICGVLFKLVCDGRGEAHAREEAHDHRNDSSNIGALNRLYFYKTCLLFAVCNH